MKKTLIIIAIVIAAVIVLYFIAIVIAAVSVLYFIAKLMPVGMMLPFLIGAGVGAVATLAGQSVRRYIGNRIKSE